jgi:dTDP-4-amino-4,6-dideoxygalactose transaminase
MSEPVGRPTMGGAVPIPMLDLKAEYALFGPELQSVLIGVLESGQFVLGPQGAALERELAQYCGVEHAVGVANGTEALHLALRALGIGPGHEVITSAFTFIGTAEAISYTGATPVFVDIEPDTFNLDPGTVQRAITSRTRAVMPVHLFGQCARMDRIQEICDDRGIPVVEDCAQSIGADFDARACGSWGVAGCFSFYPSKNLGAYGDGGMVVTKDGKLADEMRVLRNHGSRVRYHHHVIGYNSRLDEMQAAILRVKFKHIDKLNALRREKALAYNARLARAGLATPSEHGRGRHIYHQYTLRSPKRDAIKAALDAAKIGSMIYYPIPLHQQDVYQEMCRGISLPHSEEAARTVLSLPMFPMLTEEQIGRVCEVVIAASRQ